MAPSATSPTSGPSVHVGSNGKTSDGHPLQGKRFETDSLGERVLPADALYGINSLRALENFPITGRPIGSWPQFIQAFALIKQAAARANVEAGSITQEQADAISAACEDVKAGKYNENFVVDMMEGSGGTSTNMNVNEVIANIAAKASGRQLSDYSFVHPNDTVNIGQSTNDVVPTAMKLAVYSALQSPIQALERLADTFAHKREAYATLFRLGRTCLQDAQPMTLGQALGGYEAVIRRHRDHLSSIRDQFLAVPLGGTAIGTGFGSRPAYKEAVFRHLSQSLGVTVQPAGDAFDGMQNMDTCARLSAELRNTANSLWKVANDLILLSSGPKGGLGEITLPSVQAGSSIMPGKVNPVIPIAVCQIAFAISGNDTSVSMACQQGMLEINHFELIVCDKLRDSMHLLSVAADIFATKCVEGMVANKDISEKHVLESSALATALVPTLGYAQVSSLVKTAQKQQRSYLDAAIGQGLIKPDEVQSILENSVYNTV